MTDQVSRKVCGEDGHLCDMCKWAAEQLAKGEPMTDRSPRAVDPNWGNVHHRRIAELEGEVDRLRAALQEIRLIAGGQVTQYAAARRHVEQIASRALDEGEETR